MTGWPLADFTFLCFPVLELKVYRFIIFTKAKLINHLLNNILPCYIYVSFYIIGNCNDAYVRYGEHTLISTSGSQVSNLTKLFHALDVHLAGDGRLVKAHDLSDVSIVSRGHLLTNHIVPRSCKSRE